MDNLITTSINKRISDLKSELQQLKSLQSNVNWSQPLEMAKRHKGADCIGVYKVIHKPSRKVMSIGQGNVSARKARHLQVFRNKGKDLISKNGSASPSATGRAMFKFDSDINNWLFSFVNVGHKSIASEYEYQLQQKELPLFNSLHMAGKS